MGGLARHLYNKTGTVKSGSIRRSSSTNVYGDATQIVLAPSSGKKLAVLHVNIGAETNGELVKISFVEDSASTTETTVIIEQAAFTSVRLPINIDMSSAPVIGGVDEPIKFKTGNAAHVASVSIVAVEL